MKTSIARACVVGLSLRVEQSSPVFGLEAIRKEEERFPELRLWKGRGREPKA